MASASKKLPLRRLFEIEAIDIIMLQETLGSAEHITSSLYSISLGWNYMEMDVVGRSGGLAIGYNPKTIRVTASWGGHGFLGLDLFSEELGTNLQIVNIYGPCQQREHFWQHLLGLSIFSSDHIIIGGDLNFSPGYGESWGSMAQVDSISGFMTDLLEQFNLMDVPMNKPLSTWRNRRVGEASLARRLERFIMKRPLLQQLHHYKQRVGTGGILDHSPIYLKILGPHHKLKAPFKFNHVWLQDPTYVRMVSDFWVANPIDRSDSMEKGFCFNLSKLKHLSINWAREKHQRENSTLLHIELELSSLLDERSLGFITAEDKSHLVELENHKAQILKEREESIYIRSRAIWLKAGNDNTRFFNDDEAKALFAPVTSGELEGTLKWFKKDKSLGLDGWTIEFYLAFYDLLGQDLLKVVEECRLSGSLYNAINSTFIALIPKSDNPSSFNDYRPISLCNCLYKTISKIIANRLYPILSRHISP
eukprot:PITA_03996